MPTFRPTARPSVANTAFPTSATAKTVSFTADQDLDGVSISDYNNNKALNEATIKTAIAGCMDGVTSADFAGFVVTGGDRRRLLESFSLRRVQGSDYINMVYTVRVSSKLTASQLFNQLSNKVSDGTFDILLNQAAVANTASDLLNAQSSSVSEYDDGNNGNRLSDGAIAGIIVGVVFGVLLLALVIYLFAVGAGGGSSGAEPVKTGPPTEL